jgi:hypothetical protein
VVSVAQIGELLAEFADGLPALGFREWWRLRGPS